MRVRQTSMSHAEPEPIVRARLIERSLGGFLLDILRAPGGILEQRGGQAVQVTLVMPAGRFQAR